MVLRYASWIQSFPKKKNNAAEISFWRRCCGLTREDHVRNDIITEIMETEVTLTDTIEAKQLKRYVHVKRTGEDSLPKKIYEWTPTERKKKDRQVLGRRRQNKQWMEEIYGKRTT
jgi:hypothetical protein